MAVLIVTHLPWNEIAADALDNQLVFKKSQSAAGPRVMGIEIISGSVQFSADQPVGPNSPTYSAGDKTVISLMGSGTLWYKTANVADTFTITE